MKRIISILLILTVLSIYAESKYAFVDIDRVFSEYKGINDINTQIDKEMRDWKDQMTTMEKDINALEKDFAEEAPMLSEEAKVRKRDEINKKRKQLDLFIEEIWGENGKAANINLQLLKPVAEKINAVISEMAVQGKYAGIFDISEGNVLYVDPELDITQIVIDELNKEFFIPVQTLKQYIVYDIIAEDKETRNEQYHIKLATSLYRNLSIQNEMEAINIRDINNILQARGILNIEDLTVADAINIAVELNAEYAITGSISMSGSRIIITVSLYDIEKRDLIKEINKEASGDLDFDNISAEILTEIKTLIKQ